MNWNLYNKRLTTNGKTQKERAVNKFQKIANDKFTNHPSCKQMFIDEVEQNFIVFDTDDFDEKNFCTMPNETIEIGTIAFWNNEHWAVSHIDYDDEIYRKGRFLKCNHLLRWQDTETGKIYEMWSVFKKPYSTGVDENNVITVQDAKYKLSISYNEFTKKFFIDKRLAVGKLYQRIGSKVEQILDVYSIIDFNPVTQTVGNNGFVEIVLKKDTYNPNSDSLELEICDYINPIDVPPEDNPSLLVSKINGKVNIKNSGIVNYYDSIFYDVDGAVDNTIIPFWDISCDEETLSKIKIVYDGNKIGISCSDDDMVGNKVKLILSDMDNLYNQVYMEICIISIFG